MSDDLVKRLREKAFRTETADLLDEAADRIEQLDASFEECEEIADEYFDVICERNIRIEKLEEALREIITHCEVPEPPNARALRLIAREALEGKE